MKRGATIVYATHIFDGLDDWPTHIHYLHYPGRTGWQGRLEENEYYMELRASGHPSPMLKVRLLNLALYVLKVVNMSPLTKGCRALVAGRNI